MSWIRQVLHVAWKDIRFARWVLGLHLFVVGAGTAAAVARLSALPGGLRAAAVIVTGMLLTATVVQADSPSRVEASWGYSPLRPSAVFVAKSLVVLLAVPAAPLVGQLAALSAFGVTVGEMPALLGASLLTYCVWLGIAAIAAAVSPDLRTAAVVAVIVAVARSVMQEIAWSAAGPRPPGTASVGAEALLLLGLVAALAYQYQARRRTRGLVFAGIVLGASALLPAALSSVGPSGWVDATTDLPPGIDRPDLAIQGVEVRAGELEVEIEGRAPEDSGHRWRLVDTEIVLSTPDGDRTRLRLPGYPGDLTSPFTVSGLYTADSLRWVNRVPYGRSNDLRQGIRADITTEQGDRLAAGRVDITVRGRIQALEPRLIARLSPRVGAIARSESRTLRITRALDTPDGPSFEVRTSAVLTSYAAPDWDGFFSTLYVLVNGERDEAAALTVTGGSSRRQGLVMPGVSVLQAIATLSLGPLVPPTRSNPVTEPWLEAAELRVIHWVRVGGYPVEIGSAESPSTT